MRRKVYSLTDGIGVNSYASESKVDLLTRLHSFTRHSLKTYLKCIKFCELKFHGFLIWIQKLSFVIFVAIDLFISEWK